MFNVVQIVGLTILSEHIEKKFGSTPALHKGWARAVLDDTFAFIRSSAVDKKKSVRIPYFGSFKIRDVPARTARNPKTGEKVDVPAKVRFQFKASKAEKK